MIKTWKDFVETDIRLVLEKLNEEELERVVKNIGGVEGFIKKIILISKVVNEKSKEYDTAIRKAETQGNYTIYESIKQSNEICEKLLLMLID